MPLLPMNNRAFRAAATGAAMGAVMLAGATLAPRVAAAQQSSPASIQGVTINTDCQTFRPNEIGWKAKCEIIKGELLRREGRALDVDIAKLKAEGRSLDQELACRTQIIEAARAKKIVIDFPQPPPGQFCAKARQLGLQVSSLDLR